MITPEHGAQGGERIRLRVRLYQNPQADQGPEQPCQRRRVRAHGTRQCRALLRCGGGQDIRDPQVGGRSHRVGAAQTHPHLHHDVLRRRRGWSCARGLGVVHARFLSAGGDGVCDAEAQLMVWTHPAVHPRGCRS